MRSFLFLISIFCLSQSGHWARWSEAAPELLGFWRLFIASLLLGLYNWRSLRIRQEWQAAKTTSKWYALLAGFLFFAHLWTFHYQAQHTRIANGMILFASNPLFTAFVTMVFFGEKLNLRLAMAYILAIMGIYLLVAHQLKFEPTTLSGDIAAIVSAALYSAYIVSSRQARLAFDNKSFTLILFPVAGFCFLLTLLGSGLPLIPVTSKAWIASGGLAVMSTLLGHGLFVYLLRYMNINLMSCGKLLEPVLAALTAWLLFSEEVNSAMIFSFVLTAASVVVLFMPVNFFKRRPREPNRNPESL